MYTRTDFIRDHLNAKGAHYPLRVHTEPGDDGAVTIVRPRQGHAWGQGTVDHLKAVLDDLIGVAKVYIHPVRDRIVITWRGGR